MFKLRQLSMYSSTRRVPVLPITGGVTPRVPVVPVTGTPQVPVLPITGAPRVPILPVTGTPRVPIPPVIAPQVPITTTPLATSPVDQTISLKLIGVTFPVYNAKLLSDSDLDVEYQELPEISGVINPQSLAFIWSMKLFITNYGDRSIYLMDYVMQQSETYLNAVLSALELGELNAPRDVKYNLLWYLQVASDPYGLSLNVPELHYITRLSPDALRKLLGPNYNGPMDHASLLFAAISGYRTPTPNVLDLPRYQEVIAYPPAKVWDLAQKVYHIINEDLEIISEWPPYVYLAIQDKTIFEIPYVAATPENVRSLLDNYRIISGRAISNPMEYFQQEIIQYEPVFKRNPETFLPPPMLIGLDPSQVQDRLSIYTLKEIADAYEINQPWSGRRELVDLINTGRRGGSMWSWRHRHCNNDETMNVIDFEPHGSMNKENPQNPTLSYGVIGNYRCYQIEELIESWRTLTDGTFIFTVPDYSVGAIDPITNTPLVDRFPLESIRQLDQVLQTNPFNYNPNILNELRAKIQEGFDVQNVELQLIRTLKSQYDQMTPEHKSLVNIYLAWVFMFGFWMRFWRGPGYPWTTSLAEMRRQAGGKYKRGGMCPLERDEHSAIQHDIYGALRENFEQDPALKTWIENLPQGLTPRWTSDEWNLGLEPRLDTFVQRLTLGACQQGGGKYLPMSGYYLITRLLGVNNIDGFNHFMNQVIPYVNQIEQQIVEIRLSKATELGFTPEQVDTLRERQHALQQPFLGQPPFNSRQMDEVPDTDLP